MSSRSRGAQTLRISPSWPHSAARTLWKGFHGGVIILPPHLPPHSLHAFKYKACCSVISAKLAEHHQGSR